jgi:alkylation response protein AidB-like acyl-CoA dehydrogenase
VTGQKVWTSNGQLADRGMPLARTNESAPKHQSLTWFALDIAQSGRGGTPAPGDDGKISVH